MKAADFHKLPRAIQDRFVGSVMSGFPPAPLLAQRGGTQTKLLWVGLSVGSFIGIVVVTKLGYGSLDSSLSLHTWRALLVYGALVFGVAFGLVQAWTIAVRERALPYAAGLYLFPACVIDARSDRFRVYDTKELSGVDVRGSSVRVAFGSTEFMFPVADASRLASIVAEIQAARDRSMHAHATEDPKELVAVDPLHNPRFSSPVGPRDSYEVKLPAWKTFGWAVAAIVAVIFAPTLWALRNSGSDKTMYARATKENDTASYRAYLERGHAYKAQVADFDLPRAELREAVAAGTVEALVAYKTAHPQSHIGNELAGELRTAMLAELEKAKSKLTLEALNDFAKRYPDHGVEPEYRTAVHAVYARELEGYKQRAPTKDKSVVPFVERLFAWVEKRGPRVEIRFRRKKSESLGRADGAIAKTPSFAGEVSYPTHYFDEKHAIGRESALGKTLTSKFDAGLSAELFDVTMGAVVPVEAENLPDVSVPTLFISHGAEWSGHSYQATRPRGAYVGIIMPFEAFFVIPGDPKAFKFKYDLFKPAPLQLLKEDDTLTPGPAEEKVYETMGQEGFEQYGKRLLTHFFADKGDKSDKSDKSAEK